MSEQEYFNVADIFGENVFNDAVMQERLPKKVYKKLHEVMDEGKELDLETADVIAHEMKEWAIEKGAYHIAGNPVQIGGTNLDATGCGRLHISAAHCSCTNLLQRNIGT